MMKVFKFVSANLRWLLRSASRAWRAWAPFLVVVILATAVSFVPGTPEDHARYVGVVLQLMGIGTVVVGLRGRQMLFRRPSLFRHLADAFAHRPRWSSEAQVIHVTAGGGIAMGGQAKVSTWKGISPESTSEMCIAILQENLETLRKEQTETSRGLHEERSARIEQIDSERTARTKAVEDLRIRMEDLGVGSLNVERAGVFWLSLGVLFGTVPGEMAAILPLP